MAGRRCEFDFVVNICGLIYAAGKGDGFVRGFRLVDFDNCELEKAVYGGDTRKRGCWLEFRGYPGQLPLF